MSRPALCPLLSSPRLVLKNAPLRSHEGLVSPGAPLGSLNGILMTDRILGEHSSARSALQSPRVNLGSPRARENSGFARLECKLPSPLHARQRSKRETRIRNRDDKFPFHFVI
eukprot:scaffold56196_cov61-Phaeocystis_antarctica.AAC.1